MSDLLLAKKEAHVATITINNPTRRNAMSLEMWQGLAAALRSYADDPDVRVVIVTGAGEKAFVSGADISKFESERATPEAVQAYDIATADACHALQHFPKPVIARIGGVCVGGGLNIASNCDLRIAADHARFALPAAKLGLGYGYPSLRRLADIMGTANALELAYTGMLFSAKEVRAMGFLNRVVAVSDLDKTINDYAARIAKNAPLTVATFKAAAIELQKHEAERDVARVQAMVDQCFASEDYVEGRRAFMEKRKPDFKGR